MDILEKATNRKLSNVSPISLKLSSIVNKAKNLFGDNLLGVVVFGSYARSEATESSDIDILVVVSSSIKIDRNLYRKWQQKEESSDLENFNGLELSVNFSNLPERSFTCSGLWLEISLDGIVVWDPNFILNKFLISVRKHIALGEVSYRETHGQRYWVWKKEAA